MTKPEVDNKHLAAIAKTLAYLCVNSPEMKKQSLGERAKFLRSLGFPDKDVAALLNTSENSIRVLISLSKKSKKKRNSKTIQKEGQ
jgi:hypothetical protein